MFLTWISLPLALYLVPFSAAAALLGEVAGNIVPLKENGSLPLAQAGPVSAAIPSNAVAALGRRNRPPHHARPTAGDCDTAPTDSSTPSNQETLIPSPNPSPTDSSSGVISPTAIPAPTDTTAAPAPTDSSTASVTSSTASPTCSDIVGDFVDGVLNPWYISDQWTADSRVVEDGPEGTEYSFALIPSQDSYAQVYLNQLLPSCGSPPPLVTLTVRFQYQFTGASEGCSIRARVNRNPGTELLEIADDEALPGEWQSYTGSPTEVRLTYDPLFTVQVACTGNTPRTPAILITDISVY